MSKSRWVATDFIANSKRPSGYSAGDIVEFIGWSTSGDGGAAQWKATGNVIAPSQTPKLLGTTKCSDSSGNELELVITENKVLAKSIGVIGDGVTDDTLALNAAGNTNHLVDVSGLTMYITNGVGFNYLKGNSVKDSVFKVDENFNLSAQQILLIKPVDGGVISGGIGVECYQPDTSIRSEVIQYPYALSFQDRSRASIDSFRCSGAYNGVNATGNTGGAKVGTLELGALNIAISVDGAKDFWHADTIHVWPFGITQSSNLLNDVYYDGTTIGATIGDCDGLDIKTLSAFRVLNLFVPGADLNGPFGNIGTLQLDGSNSRVEFSSGHVSVSSLYKTSATSEQALICTGGELTIGTHDITPFSNSTQTEGFIECTGGYLDIGRGISRATMADAPNYRCSGGEMNLGVVNFKTGNDVPRSVGFIDQTGGRMTVLPARFKDKGAGTGPALSISGGSWSDISCKNRLGWDILAPQSLGNITLTSGDNFIATPSVSFQSNGDFAPTYATQSCSYSVTSSYVDFQLDLVFDANAYTTASGPLIINTGIPYFIASALTSMLTIVILENVTFGVNQVVTGNVEGGGSNIILRGLNSAGVISNFGPANFPASTSDIRIKLTGRYKS